ncbi:MAG TPA: insulinase family protein [Allosphingosinicella sp.]|jgi:zinc protease|nr:insulinase family protein [Allosphingosinicella sp.]
MIGHRLRAAAAFLLFTAAFAPAAAKAPNQESSKAAVPVITPDPAVRFGTLPNGFRYAVMQNKGPAGAVSVRLLVKVGSYEEADDELGYAHYIEHMAFRATKAAPGGILDNPFAAMGVAMGRDQNAFTTVESTTYGVDIPAANPDGLRKVLDWMRSAVDGILFSPAAVNVERGVVLSELRTRDGPVLRSAQEVGRFQLPGFRSVTRLPGGTEASLNAATPARLQAFYDRWYRPENALLVLVGDVPPDQLETLAKQAFSSWTARGTAGVRPTPPATMPARGLDAMSEAGAALPPGLSSCQFGPKREAATTAFEQLRRDSYSNVWATILNKRFQHLSASGTSPLLGAAVIVNDRLPDARGTCFLAMSAADKWKEALQVQQVELRRFDRDGPTQQELDQAIEALRAPLRGASVQADSRTSAGIAQEIADDDMTGRVFASPDETLRTFGAAVAGLTTADVRKAFQEDWSGAGPLLVAMGPTPPTKDALAAAWRENEAAAAPAAYAEDEKNVAWPYKHFGHAGHVDRREVLPEFVRLHFANGTVLNFKQTDFKSGDAEVRVRFGRGESGLAAADRAPVEFAINMVPEGGLGKLDYEQVGHAFASTNWKFTLKAEPTAFELSSSPMWDQVEGELQLLAAYMTDPGFRPDLDSKMPTAIDFIFRYLKTDPMAVADDALEQKLFPGLGTLPPKEVVTGWHAADFARLLKPALTQSPVEITIVGDMLEKDAIAAVARTFGALPSRSGLAPVSPGAIRTFPAELPAEITVFHQGPQEKAAAIVMWPLYTAAPERRKEEYSLALLSGIFRERLFHEARVRMGKVYEADVANPMPDHGDQGFIAAQIQATPADLDPLVGVARRIAADLATGNIRQDELDRARQLLVAERTPQQKENAAWAGVIAHESQDPHALDELLLYSTQMAALTLDDVRAAAATWLKRNPVVARSLPQGPTTTAASH